MLVVADIETNKLENPDKLWCIVCKNPETGERYVFERPDLNPEDFTLFASTVTCWVGHYFLGFDYIHINRLVPSVYINPLSVIDTLIVSRYLNFKLDGHGLDAWGLRLSIPKLHTSISFDEYTPEILERCSGDVNTTEAIYNTFKKYIYDPTLKESLRIEHNMQLICNDLHNNGFYFNKEEADKLYKELHDEVNRRTEELQVLYPPSSKIVREIKPKLTKHGTLSRTDFRWLESGILSPYSEGCSFSTFSWIPFNPGSSKQRIDKLWEAGWKPTEKTDKHKDAEKEFHRRPTEELKAKLEHFSRYGWKTSEENLATLPDTAPDATRKLVEWLLVRARYSTLTEWMNAFSEATNRIHGNFNPIGAWTQRMSHSGPNMGNTPGKDSKYNGPELKALAKSYGIRMRSLWTVPKQKVLIGTDADGIQARVLAHYINDKEFIYALEHGASHEIEVDGVKEYTRQGTDIHTLNWNKLYQVCPKRSNAKTFYYAWLLGAGAAKVAQIFGCSSKEAKEAIKIFVDSYPGLKYLKESVIPSAAMKGYFLGFDGRKVLVSKDQSEAEYLMLGGFLQNGESVIMKHANVLWRSTLRSQKVWFKQVNFVHDEWQTEANPDDAEHIGKVQAESIKLTAERFNLNCPFKGNYKIGTNWYETH